MESFNSYSDHPQPNPYPSDSSAPSTESPALATASLILGICSLVLAFSGISFIWGSLGILLALLSRARRPMGGTAKTGLILSAIGTILSLVFCIISAVFLIDRIISDTYPDLLNDYYYYQYGSDEDSTLYDDYDLDDYLDEFLDYDSERYQGGEL